jgi:hypothetical protein
MEDRLGCKEIVWTATRVAPDYLASSRKRLVPQLIYKGNILKAWGKKQAVVLHEGFFNILPSLPKTDPVEADIAWLVYRLELDAASNRYYLQHRRTEYTAFSAALDRVILPNIGPLEVFVSHLQSKLDEKLGDGHAPDAPTLLDILGDE